MYPFGCVECDKGLPHICIMNVFFVIVIGVCAVAVVAALIRGLGAFYLNAERMKAGDLDAALRQGQQQNRMMAQRVLFQGIAIMLVVILGLLSSR